MRLRASFDIVDVAGEYMAIPVGDTTKEFNGIIALNEATAYLLKKMEQPKSKEELICILTEEYKVDRETAERDITDLLERLIAMNIIES